ncbi:M15 family metallopeptidase [Blastococcus sp. SYSU D01042]
MRQHPFRRRGRVLRPVLALAVLLAVGAAVAAATRVSTPSFAGTLGAQAAAAPRTPAASTPTTGAPTPPPPPPPEPAPVVPPPVAEPVLPSIDDPDSTWVVVNKLRPLAPVGYAPTDLVDLGGGLLLRAEATQAIVALQADAAAAGLGLTVQSAYRPYDHQQRLFANAVARFGVAGAELRSARPGFSEHQTGLAVDVGGGGCDIERCFGDTPEGRWVVTNAHRFGWLVRYPAGSEGVTGYQYEPWHLRYVGPDLATELHVAGVATLEEHFGLPPAPGYAPG